MALTITNTSTLIPVSNGITTPATITSTTAITIIHHYHYITITFTTITSFSTHFNTDILTIAITSVFSGQPWLGPRARFRTSPLLLGKPFGAGQLTSGSLVQHFFGS